MVATSSFQMETLNGGHIEEAGELSRVPAAMLHRTSAPVTARINLPVGSATPPLEKKHFCAKFFVRPLAAAAGATTKSQEMQRFV
jgi:hypothetical protein